MDQYTRVSGGDGMVRGASAAPLDDAGRIAIDLACIGCQYNLRMSDAAGRCPECGLAVGRSSVGRYLCYHEPRWVQCLAWGMNRFAVALGGSVLGVAIIVGVSLMQDHRGLFGTGMWVMVFVAMAMLAVAVGFVVLGVARATWPDPAPVTPECWHSARRMTRLSFLVGIAMAVLAIVLAAVQSVSTPERFWLMMAVTLLMWLSWLAGLVFLLLHARKLAAMIPRPWLARWTVVVMALIGLAGVVLVVLSNDWFGWYDLVVPVFDVGWTAVMAGNRSAYGNLYGYNGWSLGDPWYYHDGFVTALEWATMGAWIGLGLSVLGIVPLFLVYWSALHQEAAKAKATWAASPWRGKDQAEPSEATAETSAD